MSDRPIDPAQVPVGPRGFWVRRLVALGAFLVTSVAVTVTIVASLDTGTKMTVPVSAIPRVTGAKSSPRPRATLSVSRDGRLPVALSNAAATASGDTALLIGGATASGSAVDTIYSASRGPASSVLSVATLPGPTRDAAATTLAGKAYVFGGGSGIGADSAILRFSGGFVTAAGRLPQALMDAGVATIGDTAYVVGGFNGTASVRSIVAWKPGGQAREVARLPLPLRYPAVAGVGGRLIIAGGSAFGFATRAIYRFDPLRGSVTRIGRLARPLTRAGAAVLGPRVYVIGGRSSRPGTQGSSIYEVDPASGASARAAQLPVGVSDAAVVSLGDRILVLGGIDRHGQTLASILRLTPR